MEAVKVKSNKKRKIDDVQDVDNSQVSKSSLKNGSEKGTNAVKEDGKKKKVKIVEPGDTENQSGLVNATKRQKKQPKDDNSAEVSGEETGEDGKAQLNNKQLKKLKQKRKKQKKKKGLKKLQEIQEQKNEEVATADKNERHRDFASDLSEYLSCWRQHQLSSTKGKESSTASEPIWKFNKVLQEWALQHCLDKQYVSSDLFKNLIPYILTVQGKAKDRLMAKLEETNNQEDSNEPQTDNDDSNADTEAILLSIAKKRAARLLKLFAALKD